MTNRKQGAQLDPERILTRITLELGQHQELRDILKVVLEGFKDLLDARKALFAICDEEGRIQQAVVEGLEWSGDLDALPISRTVLREAFQGNGPVLLADALSDHTYSARTSVRQNELRMIVALPVRSQEELIGILYADSPRRARGNDFTQYLDALKALSTLVSLVVDNARLYAEQRFRARYLARLAHDLRGNIHSASLNATFLQSALKPASIDEQDALQDLVLGLTEMNRRLTNSSHIAEQDDVTGPERFALQPLLERMTQSVPALAREHQISIALDLASPLPMVVGWPSRLHATLDNLLSNALKFANPGSTITISAAPRADRCPPGVTRRTTGDAAFLFQQVRPLVPDPSSGFVEISIHNHGPPIDVTLMPRLFEAYVCEGGSRRGVRSTGLGLSIVAEAVERTGGRVWVESSTATGTRVHFTLPQSLTAPPQSSET